MKSLASIVLAFGLLTACGGDDDDDGGEGGSGVDQGQQLTELDAAEVSAVCEWSVEIQGGEESTTECEGFTYNVGTVAECESEYSEIPDGCTLTVGDLEVCVEVLADDPCTGITSQDCAALLACAG
jgi:hypothetical protein